MDAITKDYHHDIPQQNSCNHPYYEKEFKDRLDMARVVVPNDDVAGSVFLMMQILTPTEDLGHHLSILKLLYTHIAKSKTHQALMQRILTQFCINQLYKYGNLHLLNETEYKQELLDNKDAIEARKYLLLILQSMTTHVDFLEKAFGYLPPMEQVNGQEMIDKGYTNDFSKVFKVTKLNIEQIIDNDIFLYLNQNTNNYLGIKQYADKVVYTQTHFNEIINQLLFDIQSLENQILCSQIFYNICCQTSHIQKYLSQTNEAIYLSNIIHQLQATHNVKNNKMFKNLIECLFIQAKYVQSLSLMINNGIFSTLQNLAIDDQMDLSEVCSQLIIEMLLSDSSVLKMIENDFPYKLMMAQARSFELYEDVYRLIAMCVKEFTLAQYFNKHLDEVFEILINPLKPIPPELQVMILNAVSVLPDAQIHIRELLQKNKEQCTKVILMFQPETRDFFLPVQQSEE